MSCLSIKSLSLTALALFALAGCGGTSGQAVQGTVTLDGQPVASGSIVFLPTSDTGRKGAAAIENGKYTIGSENGLLPGKYRVEVSWHKPTGRKIPSADPGMTADETKEAVPAKYNTDSTLTAEIGSSQAHDFALTSK